jgi:uncharacterized membrane protein
MDQDERRLLTEETRESRWEAAPAVVIVIALQLVLALVSLERGSTLWGFPWWVWMIAVAPETLLVLALVLDSPRRALERMGHRENAALALLALITVANALALIALMGSLLSGHEESGGQLLLKAAAIWGTNVVAYALWFWAFDSGGHIRRREPNPPPPDFRFPQMENPKYAEPDWHPRLLDYVYVSFTNAMAFSPTDAMPLTRRAKLLMLSESGISSVTVLLVAARAVNILE